MPKAIRPLARMLRRRPFAVLCIVRQKERATMSRIPEEKKGQSKKYALLNTTFELLKEMPPDHLTARRIAAECDCTPTVIYKHFESLKHLIMVASVRFLEQYIEETQSILKNDSDAFSNLRTMWLCFSDKAFHNPEIFLMMFWGIDNDQLGDVIFEYYELFPQALHGLDGLFTTVFFSNNLHERDFVMVRRAAVAGAFDIKDARMISDMECTMFYGCLSEFSVIPPEQRDAKPAIAHFMNMLDALFDKFHK